MRSKTKPNSILLFLMSTFVVCQLLAELSRKLINYDYPIHDLRLVIICSLASGFGLCLLCMISRKFAETKSLHWIYGGSLITCITIILIPGFDNKTNVALIIPIIVSIVLILFTLKNNVSWNSVKYLITLIIFISSISLTSHYFHELIFFLIIALLLAFLFIQQAIDYSKEVEKLQAEKLLSAKLEFKLSQVQQTKKSQTINIESTGKIEKLATQDIFYCQASGDYVEIFIQNRELLFRGSLKSIADLLPHTFIKVHRSYIVNLEKVDSLKRESEHCYLHLSNQARIPVSRRMVPNVKKSLSEN